MSQLNAHSVGLGTTSTTGRNAGVGTAIGTVIFNSTTTAMQVYAGAGAGWLDATSLPGSSQSNPAETAQDVLDSGQTTNGLYWINLGGTTAKQIFCIVDGSIETGFAYMRVWDQRTASSSTTVEHFHTGNSDYSNWKDIGGENFAITHLAVAPYNNGGTQTLAKYTNGGGGLHSSLSPKTIAQALGQSWSGTGFESDNFKLFGAGTAAGTGGSQSQSQLYIIDDNDTGCGRQTSCTGTPNGALVFPNNTGTGYADFGGSTYGNLGTNAGVGGIVALYVR